MLKTVLAASAVIIQPLLIGDVSAASDLPAMIVLVRHGDTIEVPGVEPRLTEAGKKRADDLAVALRETKLSGIIATQFVRTQETAQPIATRLGLTPVILSFDRTKTDAYVGAVKQEMRKYVGGAVLVVGHQRSVPPLIEAYGGPKLPIICENRFENLFVLSPGEGGKAHLVHSRYGAINPTSAPDCM